MTKPQALQWEYDQSPVESESAFTTFSIGVYQWLPKTSGNGLKKSKTIRVKGYVAEPNRVYEKARELCRKLNAERVSFEKPPAWLQTQCSRIASLTMMFKLAESAARRWRMLNGHELLPDVIQGVVFQDGLRLDQAAA